jgi:hypothetical protein
MSDKTNLSLTRAPALSNDMVSAADKGDLQTLALLDRQRMELLQFFRNSSKTVAAADQALLAQIAEVNARAIGLLEHQRRSKGRDLDIAAVGRQAVAAYSGTRSQR